MNEPNSNAPGAIRQALRLFGIAVILAIAADLLIPDGILAQRATVLRDLELQVPVHLFKPAAVAQASEQGGTLLFDARTQEEFARGHIQGAVSVPLDSIDERFEELATMVSAQKVIVILNHDEVHEARELALRLATELGAEEVGTIDGGWQALPESLREAGQ